MLEVLFVGAVIGLHLVLFGIYRKLDTIAAALVIMAPVDEEEDENDRLGEWG